MATSAQQLQLSLETAAPAQPTADAAQLCPYKLHFSAKLQEENIIFFSVIFLFHQAV